MPSKIGVSLLSKGSVCFEIKLLARFPNTQIKRSNLQNFCHFIPAYKNCPIKRISLYSHSKQNTH